MAWRWAGGMPLTEPTMTKLTINAAPNRNKIKFLVYSEARVVNFVPLFLNFIIQILKAWIRKHSHLLLCEMYMYRKVSNIRRTKCQNLNDSRLVLQLSVPNPLKASVKSIMKM